MPLDERIPFLAVNPPAQATTLGAIMDIKEKVADTRAKEEARIQAQEARKIYQEANGDPRKAVVTMRQRGMHVAADLFELNMAKTRQTVADAMSKELNNQKTMSDDIAQIFNGVKDPATYQIARQRVITKYGPYAAEGFPDTYDQNFVQSVINEGTTIAEQNRIREKAVSLLNDAPKLAGEGVRGIAGVMAASDDQEDWDHFKALLRLYKVSDEQMAFLPDEFSPEVKQQMIQMSMTPEKNIDVEQRKLDAEARREAARQTAENQRRDDERAAKAARDLEAHRAEQRRLAREREKRLAGAAAARTAAGGRVTDDRTLPFGVQDYMRKLVSKYSNHKEAADELARAEYMLKADHPNLSMEKAEDMLRGLFDKKKQEEEAKQKQGAAGGQQPQARGVQTATTKKGTVSVGQVIVKGGKRYIVESIDADSGEIEATPIGPARKQQ